MPADDLKATLDALIAGYDHQGRRAADPIAFPHRWPAGPDREVVALFAGLLAYGRADLIGRALAEVTARMGPAPAAAAAADDPAAARRRFDGVVYRFTRGDDLARLWLGAGALIRESGSLGAAVMALDDPAAPDLRPLLGRLRAALVAPTAAMAESRGFLHLLCDPAAGSACKRYNMWLRWMVRGPDEVDFGAWRALGPHRLTMPVDTHIHRISRALGLTARAQADWRCAVEITDALRRLDAADPLRYDFALAHLGISGACPRRQVPAICAGCPIRRICCLPA
ncbi:MAG: TIGR02757 family protein [Myxococcales bacterium]|nr:TIGR02757 family protein [Myxococcales bacterium]